MRISRPAGTGGDEGIRTLDPLLAGQVLSQLSYTPVSLRPSGFVSLLYSLTAFFIVLLRNLLLLVGYREP